MGRGLSDNQNEIARTLLRDLWESGRWRWQQDLADALGMSMSVLSRLLTPGSTYGTSFEVLVAAARLANVDPAQALGISPGFIAGERGGGSKPGGEEPVSRRGRAGRGAPPLLDLARYDHRGRAEWILRFEGETTEAEIREGSARALAAWRGGSDRSPREWRDAIDIEIRVARRMQEIEVRSRRARSSPRRLNSS